MSLVLCQLSSPPIRAESNDLVKYAPPAYKREVVNKAGRKLAGDGSVPLDRGAAIAIVHNWRLGHNRPLNSMYMSLKGRAPKVGKSAIVAQRLERLESIEAKLSRGEVEKLTQIQDIGGCRVVFPTLAQVQMFAQRCSAHTQTFEYNKKFKDYIQNPKATGYRSTRVQNSFE